VDCSKAELPIAAWSGRVASSASVTTLVEPTSVCEPHTAFIPSQFDSSVRRRRTTTAMEFATHIFDEELASVAEGSNASACVGCTDSKDSACAHVCGYTIGVNADKQYGHSEDVSGQTSSRRE
jgi:hypothetical protein